MMTIHFGHSIDYIQTGMPFTFLALLSPTSPMNTSKEAYLTTKTALGYGFTPSPKTLVASRRTHQKVLSSTNALIKEFHPITSDDTIFLHGTISSGIPLSFSLRGGKPFPDTPGLEWRIYGETGEIRVTSSGPFLNIGYPDVKIAVFDFDLEGGEAKKVEVVEVKKDEFDGEEWGMQSRNVARLYKGLSEGEVNCSFEDAVQRHELIEGMYRENAIVV